MFSLRNVKHTDTGSFGLLFDVVRHEAAEVRPGGFRDFQDRSRDRLSAYDADRRSFVAERQRKDRYLSVDKPVSPEDRRLPVESVLREDVSAHEPMQNQPAEKHLPVKQRYQISRMDVMFRTVWRVKMTTSRLQLMRILRFRAATIPPRRVLTVIMRTRACFKDCPNR